MTLVYANIAISWQLLGFNSLKKHFPQIYRFKGFKNGLEKKFPDLKFFSLILAEKPLFFPDFPDWKKSSKFSLNSLISLIGGNPALWRYVSHSNHSGLRLSFRRSFHFKFAFAKSVSTRWSLHRIVHSIERLFILFALISPSLSQWVWDGL